MAQSWIDAMVDNGLTPASFRFEFFRASEDAMRKLGVFPAAVAAAGIAAWFASKKEREDDDDVS
jgi:hypothetical protein